ncbi:MAG: sigma-54-dependent Fis family transcriptional regulator [Acidobacteria bacterium]|nr:MAG: sigma-54-dependent Fis family transcriptional regulator [Acidobacteriota bacterium]
MGHYILIVDDDPAVRFGLRSYLETLRYSTREASTLEEARQVLSRERINAILLDLNLPDGNSMSWLSEIKEEWPQVAIIVITGKGDIPTAVQAMRKGADHFATKPMDMDELAVVLEKSLEIGALRRLSGLRSRYSNSVEPFFGFSSHISRVRQEVEVAVASDAATLLQGETGSGKTLLAAWIHERTARKSGPFIDINCGGLRGEMLASELFGHAKGAFTGAVEKKQGLLEMGDEGTVFLDEIGDMDLEVQSQLLKVLETKTFRRMGEVRDRHSDFRLICATNRNLVDQIQKGRFRQDLYYRIAVLSIRLPSLKEYMEDLPHLCQHILRNISRQNLSLSPDAIKLLSQYDWPGNIRELRNVLERAALLTRSNVIDVAHFPFHMFAANKVEQKANIEAEIRQKEADHIQEVIERCHGNVNQAAQILGLSRATLYRRLSRLKASHSRSSA